MRAKKPGVSSGHISYNMPTGRGLALAQPPFPFTQISTFKYMQIHLVNKNQWVAQWSGGRAKSLAYGEVRGSNPAASITFVS